jgi:hypothetical protein
MDGWTMKGSTSKVTTDVVVEKSQGNTYVITKQAGPCSTRGYVIPSTASLHRVPHVQSH